MIITISITEYIDGIINIPHIYKPLIMILNSIIFLLFPLMLFLVPAMLYNNRSETCMTWWVKLTMNKESRKILAKLLALAIGLFHIATFAIFPHEIGMMFSIPIIAYAASTKRVMPVITKIRNSRKMMFILSVVVLALALIPHGYVLACSIAFFILAACFLPGPKAEKSLEDCGYLTDEQSKFFDDYFN